MHTRNQPAPPRAARLTRRTAIFATTIIIGMLYATTSIALTAGGGRRIPDHIDRILVVAIAIAVVVTRPGLTRHPATETDTTPQEPDARTLHLVSPTCQGTSTYIEQADTIPLGSGTYLSASGGTDTQLRALHARISACEQRVEEGLRRFDDRWEDVDALKDVQAALPVASGDGLGNVRRLPRSRG